MKKNLTVPETGAVEKTHFGGRRFSCVKGSSQKREAG